MVIYEVSRFICSFKPFQGCFGYFGGFGIILVILEIFGLFRSIKWFKGFFFFLDVLWFWRYFGNLGDFWGMLAILVISRVFLSKFPTHKNKIK